MDASGEVSYLSNLTQVTRNLVMPETGGLIMAHQKDNTAQQRDVLVLILYEANALEPHQLQHFILLHWCFSVTLQLQILT